MKILVDVIVTNMESGHVAVSQQVVDVNIGTDYMPKSTKSKRENNFYEILKKQEFFKPHKVGPLLIDRSFIALCED